MKNPRKPLVLGFAVASAVLMASSTALACTVWRGTFTVTGTGGSPGAGSGTVVGWGANTGMNHCPTEPWQGQAKVHAGGNGHTSSVVTVEVGRITDPLSCGGNDNWLSASSRYGTNPQNYNINFLNTGFGDFIGVEPAREYVRDCMTGAHRSTFTIGQLNVNNGVGGPTNFTIDKPANHPSGQAEIRDLPGTESAICISGPGNSIDEGMQNPITVI